MSDFVLGVVCTPDHHWESNGRGGWRCGSCGIRKETWLEAQLASERAALEAAEKEIRRLESLAEIEANQFKRDLDMWKRDFGLQREYWTDAEHAKEELAAQLAAAVKALRHLRNEAHGLLHAEPERIRDLVGNTNFSCAEHALEYADNVLAGTPAAAAALLARMERMRLAIQAALVPAGDTPEEVMAQLKAALAEREA